MRSSSSSAGNPLSESMSLSARLWRDAARATASFLSPGVEGSAMSSERTEMALRELAVRLVVGGRVAGEDVLGGVVRVLGVRVTGGA